jgi:hypothetical protein
MKNWYVCDNGFETNFREDRDAAADAVREAQKDGRCAHMYQA